MASIMHGNHHHGLLLWLLGVLSCLEFIIIIIPRPAMAGQSPAAGEGEPFRVVPIGVERAAPEHLQCCRYGDGDGGKRW